MCVERRGDETAATAIAVQISSTLVAAMKRVVRLVKKTTVVAALTFCDIRPMILAGPHRVS
jgi:hypothetical protein